MKIYLEINQFIHQLNLLIQNFVRDTGRLGSYNQIGGTITSLAEIQRNLEGMGTCLKRPRSAA